MRNQYGLQIWIDTGFLWVTSPCNRTSVICKPDYRRTLHLYTVVGGVACKSGVSLNLGELGAPMNYFEPQYRSDYHASPLACGPSKSWVRFHTQKISTRKSPNMLLPLLSISFLRSCVWLPVVLFWEGNYRYRHNNTVRGCRWFNSGRYRYLLD